MRIFISYAHEQKESAEAITLSLRNDGHDVFFSADRLAPADEFDTRIRDEINKCHLFLFLITPESVDNGSYTLSELAMAKERWLHPKGRVLPIMAKNTPLENIPQYLQAVNILALKGNLVADVCAEVDRISSRRKKQIAIPASIILSIVVVMAYIFIPFPPKTPQIIVEVAGAEPLKKGLDWEGDSYLVKLAVKNTFDVPMEVSNISANSRSTQYHLETSYESSGSSFLSVPEKGVSSWSAVTKWVKNTDNTPLSEDKVPQDAEWQLCWSIHNKQSCGEWQTWKVSGEFGESSAVALQPSLRHEIRAIANDGETYFVGTSNPKRLLKMNFSRSMETILNELPLEGVPVTIFPYGDKIYLATQSPDEIVVVDIKTLTLDWKKQIPAIHDSKGNSFSTAPLSLAFDGANYWVITGDGRGDPALIYLTKSGVWGIPPYFLSGRVLGSHEARDMELRYLGNDLLGVSSSTPHYIYQINPDSFTQFSGHDIENIGCIEKITYCREKSALCALCNNQFIKFTLNNGTFSLVEKSGNIPGAYHPAHWNNTAIAKTDGIILLGMTRYSRNPYLPEQSAILIQNKDGQWKEIFKAPEIEVSALATNGNTAMVMLRDKNNIYDGYLIKLTDK